MLVLKQIEELEGYLEQLKADLRVAQQRHQAAVEEVSERKELLSHCF